MSHNSKSSNQVKGNIGLYFVCYELSKLGWNVMPTSRNAKGVDIVVFSQDAKRKFTVQVKALSERNPVSIGKNLESLFADFLVICRGVEYEKPEIFIAKSSEAKHLTTEHTNKRGEKSLWIHVKKYEMLGGGWEKIGDGF